MSQEFIKAFKKGGDELWTAFEKVENGSLAVNGEQVLEAIKPETLFGVLETTTSNNRLKLAASVLPRLFTGKKALQKLAKADVSTHNRLRSTYFTL